MKKLIQKIRSARKILSTSSLRKTSNIVKVLLSYQLSKYTKKSIHWGRPFSISLEPTTSCNLRCPECISGLRAFSRPTGMLQAELFKKIIDEQKDTLLNLTFYFQGEPYLNPSFLDMVRYAADRKIYTSTSTNGHYLNDENAQKTIASGLSQMIVSLDGTTQDTYVAYRIGGKLDKVIEGTKNIMAWKKKMNSATPKVILQFLVVRPNEHQIDDVKKLAEEIGVDELALKTAQIYDYKNGSDLIPTIDKYARYQRQADGTYRIKNEMENHCWKMWHSCVITWDGKVVPCCFDKDAHHTLGNVSKSSLDEVWRSPAYQQFRKQVLHSRSSIEMCQNCTEGTKVWA